MTSEPHTTPDYVESLNFLRRWSADGWWVLTAINPDDRKVTTATFSNEKPDLLLAWLKKYGTDRNIYFAVNPTREPMRKKALRADVARVAWIHVDVDPRAGEDLAKERDRALRLLREPLDPIPGPPTVIVDSGGGYQGFWRLRDSLELPDPGDVEAVEDAKLWNLAVELALGADNCHNVDRIMRLPGTINRPDERKREKGRVDALASLVEFEDDRVYTLDQFAKAPPVQASEQTTRVLLDVATVERLPDVHSLDRWGVPDRTKAIIVQGTDPNEPGKYPSRSEPLHHVCCELVRRKVPDDVIYSVITDPDFLISESILEKRTERDRDQSARRQIERAKEKAHHPKLMEMNERHFVVENVGGRCLVAEWQTNPALGRESLVFQGVDHFKNRYANKVVVVGQDKDGADVKMPAGGWWFQHEQRREFAQVVFAPGVETDPHGVYNLWRGFAFDPIPGDGHEPYLAHLRDNICRGNQEHYEFLVRWMANAVQDPGERGHVAVVMLGGQGTGKGVAAKHFGALFGRHYLPISNGNHLVGNFNQHLRDCVVLFADEALFAGDRKHVGVLKSIITEETLAIEAKYRDVEAARNCLHVIMASNEDWAVATDIDDRRLFTLEVGEDRKKDGAYFADIQRSLDDGGYANLLHHLQMLDLSGFDVRRVPQTDGLARQKEHSLRGIDALWFDVLSSGEIDFGVVQPDGTVHVNSNEFVAWAEQHRDRRDRRVTSNHVAALLGEPQGNHAGKGMRFPKDRDGRSGPRFWVIPPLAEARAAWDERRFAARWDDADDWATTRPLIDYGEAF